MRNAAAGLIFAVALGGTALAQPAAPVAPKASPDQIVAARKEGDALLSAARAQDLFDNETGLYGTAQITLRHRASGFVCLLDPGQARNSVAVYPNANRGDDVGCNTMTAVGDRTTNFTRDAHSDDQTLGGAAEAIRRRLPDAQPAAAPTNVRPFATLFLGLPTPKSARFLTAANFEEVISAHVNGWLVEDRFTAPKFFAQTNALDGIWYFTVAEAEHHRQAAAPGASAGEAAPAAGPSPSDAGAPSTPEEIAAAHKEAARILMANHAEALFDDVTDSKVAALRERRSGLICRFDPGTVHAVNVDFGAFDRAHTTNCNTGILAFSVTVAVRPNPDRFTADKALSALIASDRGMWTLTPFPGAGLQLGTSASSPRHVAARLSVGTGAGASFLHASAAVVGDWIITIEALGPAAQSMLGDLVGETVMVTAIADVAKAARPDKESAPTP